MATLLLVEDEEPIRRAMRRQLESSGYSVIAASDAGEALRLASEHRGDIHLVIADLSLPGVTGVQVVELLRAQRPGLPALYISGHADENLVKAYMSASDGFLEKPFEWTTLARRIREIIDVA